MKDEDIQISANLVLDIYFSLKFIEGLKNKPWELEEIMKDAEYLTSRIEAEWEEREKMSQYVERHSTSEIKGEIAEGVNFEVVHEEVKVKLKRCPFCGKSGKISRDYDEDNEDLIAIKCEGCGCGTSYEHSHEAAAEKWNRRKVALPNGTNKIMPCPFCAGKSSAVFCPDPDGEEGNCDMVKVVCSKCGAESKPCSDTGQAVRLWNRRSA